MKNTTLNEKTKRNRLWIQTKVLIIAMIMSTVPVFADISNIGANLGTWGVEQMGYIALAIVAFIVLRYLIKKAWPQAGVFLIVGAVMLYIIKNPDKLEAIGSIMFGIATQ